MGEHPYQIPFRTLILQEFTMCDFYQVKSLDSHFDLYECVETGP